MDLKTGQHRQLSQANGLDPGSVTLTADDSAFCYIDRDGLWVVPFGKPSRRVAALPDYRAGSAGITTGGKDIVVVSGERLLRAGFDRGSPVVLLAQANLRQPTIHPKRGEIAYLAGNALWTCRLDGSRKAQAPVPNGAVTGIRWFPNGGENGAGTLLYLHSPADSGRTVNLREYDPGAGKDRKISLTSQFATFCVNSDASVFVGASFSKAQPTLLLLIRSVARELTLCEHAAKDAATVAPVFTPDSQQVFFQTDRSGKPGIWSVSVDKLVEKTEEEEAKHGK
jgi:oligogalacturonide lyase